MAQVEKQIDMSLDDLIKARGKKSGPKGKPVQGKRAGAGKFQAGKKFQTGGKFQNKKPFTAQGPKNQRTQPFKKPFNKAGPKKAPGPKIDQALNATREGGPRKPRVQRANQAQPKKFQQKNFAQGKQVRTPRQNFKPNTQAFKPRQNTTPRPNFRRNQVAAPRNFAQPQRAFKKVVNVQRPAPQALPVAMSRGLRQQTQQFAAQQVYQAPVTKPLQFNRTNYVAPQVQAAPRIAKPALMPGEKFVLPQGTEMKISFSTGQAQMMPQYQMPQQQQQQLRFPGGRGGGQVLRRNSNRGRGRGGMNVRLS